MLNILREGVKMSLEKKILEDYKQAMKTRDKLKASILSLVRSELNYALIQKQKKELEDADVIAVIKRMIKQHKDSIEQFKKGERNELAEKETKELKILETYLPEQLSQDKIEKIIDEVIKETGASAMKDMGRVMKEGMAKCSGQADGKLVSDLVRQKLTPKPTKE